MHFLKYSLREFGTRLKQFPFGDLFNNSPNLSLNYTLGLSGENSCWSLLELKGLLCLLTGNEAPFKSSRTV